MLTQLIQAKNRGFLEAKRRRLLEAKSHRLLAGFAVLLAAAIFSFSLAGCGDGGGDPSLSGTIIISATNGGTTAATTAETGDILYAVYSGGTETVSYQWNKGGTAISSGGTNSSYTPTEAGEYTVTVSASGYQSKTSDAVAVSVSSDPTLSGTIIISAMEGGTTATTAATTGTALYAVYSGTETGLSYQWKKEDGANVATGGNYTPSAEGSYTVTVSASGYQSKTSDPCVVSEGSSSLTWTAVTNTTFGSSQAIIRGIAYGGGKFVAVGSNGKAAYSADGVTWTAVTNTTFGSSEDIRGIAYGGGKFVAVGAGGTGSDGSKMVYSADGITWTAVANTAFGSSMIHGIAYGGGKFVAVGQSGKMAYSED
jgi:hypothetical protein